MKLRLPTSSSVDLLAGFIAGVLCALLLGWKLWHTAPVHEGEALARTLPKSGAQELARDPSAPVAKPIQQAIKESGGKAERVVHLVIQPKPIPAPVQTAPPAPNPPMAEAKPAAPAPGCSCSPVSVDLALVRMKDQTRRVLALGANGEEIAGVDIPMDAISVPRALPWAAGVGAEAVVSNTARHYSAFVDRDLGPFRLGAEVQGTSRGKDVTAWVKVGIRF